jgi:hypothetical protein
MQVENHISTGSIKVNHPAPSVPLSDRNVAVEKLKEILAFVDSLCS